jgi:hypothetical protein
MYARTKKDEMYYRTAEVARINDILLPLQVGESQVVAFR